MKKDLDSHFKEKFPEIIVSFSKIQKLKKQLLDIGINEDLEYSTVAHSWVYLEKLVLKNVCTKANIRLYGGICLILASKFNDPKTFSEGDKFFLELAAGIQKVLGATPKDLFEFEFDVFSKLSFSLFLEASEILPHLSRIKKQVEIREPIPNQVET